MGTTNMDKTTARGATEQTPACGCATCAPHDDPQAAREQYLAFWGTTAKRALAADRAYRRAHLMTPERAELHFQDDCANDALTGALDKINDHRHAVLKTSRRAYARAKERAREATQHPTPENKRRAAVTQTAADKAQAVFDVLPCCTDALGQPIDRTRAGRAKWEQAYEEATGHYWGYPWIGEDESRDSNPDHVAGLHASNPQDDRCGACLADLSWALDHAKPATHFRRGRRVPCGPDALRNLLDRDAKAL